MIGRNRIKKKAVALFLVTAMIFSFIPTDLVSAAATSDLETETPALVVTGTDIIAGAYSQSTVDNEKAYTLDELKSIDNNSPYKYSSINSSNTKRFYLANGVRISDLLEMSGIENLNGKSILTSSSETPPNTVSIDFDVPRYYFPNLATGSEDNKSEVPAVLAWAQKYETAPTEPKESDISDIGYLQLVVGQTSVSDVNNSLYNKYVNKIQLGNKITETVLTVGDKNYTRADFLLMPRATHTYDTASMVARGVPMGELLSDAGNNDLVIFTTVDGSSVELKKSKLISGNYMLAYEEGTDSANLRAVYGVTEGSTQEEGFLTLYGDGATPVELVKSITIDKGIDFTNSPYKHITNGGKGMDGEANLYNIDAITSATVTVEGPAVKRSVPLSVRELESNDESLHRGEYEDSMGVATYEGIDLAYMLTEMSAGDNGIVLTDEAKKIQLKDINRNTVATLSIRDVMDASERGDPVILAYGIGKGDKVAPFVFSGALPGQYNAGYIEELKNDDGCMKLVYDLDAINSGAGEEYTKFTNAAYIYVMAENEPGFKHNIAPYDSAELKNYTFAFDGKALGREINLTTEQIEELAGTTDLGFRKEYSLANNNYWYVNEYEGVKLWGLLNYIGIPEEDSNNDNKSTRVKFTATDGYISTDSFTYEELANPQLFGYYEKNADDLGDGNYVPKPEDQIIDEEGYPVLLASGVNRYPYVINSNDEGFMSGLSNDGGPMRVIFGKREYSHANGSSQIQRLNNVNIGGDDYKYNTHKYTDSNTELGAAYEALTDSTLNVTVRDVSGTAIKNSTFSVGDIEDLIYATDIGHTTKNEAQSKSFYEMVKSDQAYSDLYEGVNLEYLIWNALEIPGIKGNITFKNGEDELTIPLEDILKTGYNTTTGQSDLKPILAFAKNGSPMVVDKTVDGYESSYSVTDGIELPIKNDGGPLAVLIPSDEPDDQSKIQSLKNVTDIVIDLKADQYAHVQEPYDGLKDSTITIKGAGTYIENEKEFKVEEIESKQTLAVTGDYNIKAGSNEDQLRYRGIALYDFLKSNAVGLRINAGKVIAKSSNGDQVEFSLSDIMKSDYINGQDSNIKDLKPILAYGSAPITESDKEVGLPLVKNSSSDGYDADFNNQGGPLKLVIGQKNSDDENAQRILNDIVEIEVTATELDSWKHSVNDTYSQYLDYELEFVIKNSDSQWSKKFTLDELESMNSIISRDEYAVISKATHEGVDLWKLVTKTAGEIQGINNPVAIKCFATDGYTADVLSSFGMDQIINGIKDGSGNRKAVIMAYATNGFPLVPSEKSDGYTGAGGGNSYGPLRLITENTSGTCLKNLKKIEITIQGSGKISVPDPQDESFKLLPSSGNTGELPLGASVRSVTVNKRGDMWVGTYNAGAHFKGTDSDYFTVNTMKTEGYKLESSVVTAVAEDGNGGVWFSQSASYIDPTANKGAAYVKDGVITYYNTDTPGTIPDDYVQEIKIDSKGNVWFGSFGGLTKYDPVANTWRTWTSQNGLPADSVNRIVIDEDDGIWVGCYPNTHSAGVEDTFTGGYCYLDQNGDIKFSYMAQSHEDDGSDTLLADSWVRDIALDSEGGVWIVRSGSYANLENVGGRIDHVDKDGNIEHYTGKALLGPKLTHNSEIRALDVDSAGNLWLGAWNGVFVLDRSLSLKEEHSSAAGSWDSANMDNVYSLNIYNNNVYIGSIGGVAYKNNIAPPVLQSIKIATKPNKTVYYEDEVFDDTGMVVMGQYSDGSQKLISDYTLDKGILKYGDTKVIISSQGKKAELSITVKKATVAKLEIVKPASKLKYKVGEIISLKGLQLKATFTNGKTKLGVPVTLISGDTKKAGKRTVVIGYMNAKASYSISVKAPVKSVKIPSKVYIVKGSKVKLPLVISPVDATDKSVKWSSKNKKIATVTGNGTVKGIKTGTVKITVKSKDSGKQSTCKVVVVAKKNNLKGLTIKSSKKVTLKVGKSKQIKVKLNPAKATGVVVKYKSGNKKIATVNAVGKITAKKKGKTKITITAGKYKKTIVVKVKK